MREEGVKENKAFDSYSVAGVETPSIQHVINYQECGEAVTTF